MTAWTFRYTHVINVAVAEGFLTESHALASEVERGRRDLLDRLLSGQPSGPTRSAGRRGSACARTPRTRSSSPRTAAGRTASGS